MVLWIKVDKDFWNDWGFLFCFVWVCESTIEYVGRLRLVDSIFVCGLTVSRVGWNEWGLEVRIWRKYYLFGLLFVGSSIGIAFIERFVFLE